MIATLITSPLGLALLVVVGLVVAALVSLCLYIREAVAVAHQARRVAYRAARADRRPRGPATVAGVLFHQAGEPGQADCPDCAGEGGRLALVDIAWGAAVEIEAQLGIRIPEGAVVALPVRCPRCAQAHVQALAAEILAATLDRPGDLLPSRATRPDPTEAPELPAFPSTPGGGAA